MTAMKKNKTTKKKNTRPKTWLHERDKWYGHPSKVNVFNCHSLEMKNSFCGGLAHKKPKI